MPLFWRIEGGGLDESFERYVPVGSMTESEVKVLLQRLAATQLTPDEVFFSSLRRGSKGRSSHLDLHIDRARPGGTISTTGTPYFVASVRERLEAEV
jgi:hypothetical protein